MVVDPAQETWFRFAVALGVGALVGFERQFAGSHDQDDAPVLRPPTKPELAAAIAAAPAPPATPPASREPVGVRTLTLLALAGAVAAHLSPTYPWLFPAAVVAVGALVVSGYHGSVQLKGDLGLTSEVASLVVFLLGALAVHGETTLAAAGGVVTAGVLSLKKGLHTIAGRISQEDIHAALKFAVLTVIVLPILPSQRITVDDVLTPLRAATRSSDEEAPATERPPPATERGPATEAAPPAGPTPPPEATVAWWRKLGLSPRKLWMMVILISAVSFAGYVLGQVLGTGRGLMVTAAMGGLVSSTAVTMAFSQRSREAPELSTRLAMGILIANAIMPARVLLLVALLDPRVALALAVPLAALLVTTAAVVVYLHVRRRPAGDAGADVPLRNPFEITPALKFAGLYAAISIVVQVAQHAFGEAGLYVVATVAGLPDADPIALAATNLARDGRIAVPAAVTAIGIAVISNTLGKGGFAVWAGAPALRRISAAAFGLMLAAAAAGIAGLRLIG